MGWSGSKERKHCRWCGDAYYARQPLNQDGFCSAAHKQAHYRAYLRWVTTSARQSTRPADLPVTPSKAKKKGKSNG